MPAKSRLTWPRVSTGARWTGKRTDSVLPHGTWLVDEWSVQDVIDVALLALDVPLGRDAWVEERVSEARRVRQQHAQGDRSLLGRTIDSVGVHLLLADLGNILLDCFSVVETNLALLHELKQGNSGDKLGA